jgi:hypothetical protein
VAFKGSMITVSAKVWGLRVALIGIIVMLAGATSGAASWALAIAWGPNGLFLWLFMRGALRLPRIMEAVHPIEPVIYRWLGVLASLVSWVYFAVGNVSFAVWTLIFNILLNGYPVMLQRSHRWRIQKVRPIVLRGSTNNARMLVP